MRGRTKLGAVVGFALAIAALVVLGGCSSSSDSGNSSGGSGEQVEVETGEGSAVLGEADALPDDFPEDVPLPDGYELGKVSTASLESQGSAVAVEMTTSQTPTELTAFYEAELADAGWTITQKAVDETGGVVNASKDGRLFSLAMNRDGDRTEMLLNTGDS